MSSGLGRWLSHSGGALSRSRRLKSRCDRGSRGFRHWSAHRGVGHRLSGRISGVSSNFLRNGNFWSLRGRRRRCSSNRRHSNGRRGRSRRGSGNGWCSVSVRRGNLCRHNRSRSLRRLNPRRTLGDRLRRYKTRSALRDNWGGGRCWSRSSRLIDNGFRRCRRRRHRWADGGSRFRRLLFTRQNCLECVAGLRDLREIDFGTKLFAAGAMTCMCAAGLT